MPVCPQTWRRRWALEAPSEETVFFLSDGKAPRCHLPLTSTFLGWLAGDNMTALLVVFSEGGRQAERAKVKQSCGA